MTIKLFPFDVGVTLIAYLFALFLRFDGSVPSSFRDSFRSFVVVAIVVQIAAAAAFGLYGEATRAQLARRILLAGLAGGSIVFMLDSMGVGWYVPKSVAILGALLTTVGMIAVRFVDRWLCLRRPTP